MKFKQIIQLLVLFSSHQLSAQELTLALSQYPNKQAVIVAAHGVRQDTIGVITLDQNGKGSLVFQNKQPQTGLVNLTIKGKAFLSYDFVLSPTESPELSCDMEFVYAQNTEISNSPENDYLDRWFTSVAQYKGKIALNQELSKLYTPEMKFAKQLATENQVVEQQLQELTDSIHQSTLFAGKYMQLKLIEEEKLTNAWESDETRTFVKNYFATQLDFEALYGSSLWFSVINSCIAAYTQESPYYQTFGTDVVGNLQRIKSQQIYEDLVDAAISVTEKFSWNKDQEVIVDFIVEDNRIRNPQGKLQKIIQLHQLAVGKKAPDLLITEHLGEIEDHNHTTTVLPSTDFAQTSFEKTLLVFYESGCGPCETLLQQLPGNYELLKEKGIDIIALAADTSEAVFKNKAKSFPWERTFCDYTGKGGVNFQNYAIIGTPTMYLIDKSGKILQKLSSLDELLNLE